MTTTLYGIKTCDTCRKARRLLDELAIDYRYHDLREEGLDEPLLATLIDSAGWQALLNTRSTTWRQLADGDKRDLDADRAQALMLAHPTLIKRPLLARHDALIVGFDKTRYAELSH